MWTPPPAHTKWLYRDPETPSAPCCRRVIRRVPRTVVRLCCRHPLTRRPFAPQGRRRRLISGRMYTGREPCTPPPLKHDARWICRAAVHIHPAVPGKEKDGDTWTVTDARTPPRASRRAVSGRHHRQVLYRVVMGKKAAWAPKPQAGLKQPGRVSERESAAPRSSTRAASRARRRVVAGIWLTRGDVAPARQGIPRHRHHDAHGNSPAQGR